MLEGSELLKERKAGLESTREVFTRGFDGEVVVSALGLIKQQSYSKSLKSETRTRTAVWYLKWSRY